MFIIFVLIITILISSFITLALLENKRWKYLMNIPKPAWVRLEYIHPMGMRKIQNLKIVSTDDDGVFYRELRAAPPPPMRGATTETTKGKESDLLWMSKDEFLDYYKSIHLKTPKPLPSAEKFELVKDFESVMETEYRKN
jgi:hypothetical protein